MRKREILLTLWLLLMLLPLPAAAKEEGVRGIAFTWVQDTPLWEGPMGNTPIVTYIGKNEVVTMIGPAKKGWQEVRYNGLSGFLYTKTIQMLTQENIELGWGTPVKAGVSLLSGPEAAAAVLRPLEPEEPCYTIGINNGFYKVLCGEDQGYVHSSQLHLTEIPYENEASVNRPRFYIQGQPTGFPVTMATLRGETPKRPDGTLRTGNDIVEEAELYLGIRYVHGGESPTGFDCSGLTYYVYNQLGFNLPRSVEAQARSGWAVGGDLLKPGDLIFFATLGGKSPSHVGIYLGEGKFLHAPNSRSKVRIDDLHKGYWRTVYVGARRLV